MADTLQLQVATPEKLLVDEQVTEVQVPAKNGYLGILAGHAALLSELGAGALSYEGGGGPHLLEVAGAVNHGQLEFSWYYQPDVHDLSTVQAVAGDFINVLRRIAHDCRETA